MPEEYATATLTALTDDRGRPLPRDRREPVDVDINPDSIDLTFTNTVQKGRRRQPPQIVTEASAKLSMELVFDTTDSGKDVRAEKTAKIAAMMDPDETRRRSGRRRRNFEIPAKVLFEWGTIRFEGYIDSYREKIEFFAREGVPLRAVVNLSLTKKERDFTPTALSEDEAQVIQTRVGQNLDVIGGTRMGDQIASQSGQESKRSADGGEAVVPGEGDSSPAAFVSGASAGAGFSLEASLSAGATGQAFAGLRADITADASLGRPMGSVTLQPPAPSTGLAIGPGASFQLGGRVAGDAGGLAADVGVGLSLSDKLEWEE